MSDHRSIIFAAFLLLSPTAGAALSQASTSDPGAAAAEAPPSLQSIEVDEPVTDAESTASADGAAPLLQPFSPGEELVYKITALGMTAGKARISVGLGAERDGKKAWPVVVQARTDSLFDSVYTVRDRFVSWWHPESGRVIAADFFADEGGKRHRSTTKLDHEGLKAEVSRFREWNGERSKRNYAIPAGSYDIAGAIFELRRRPLLPGTVEEIDVFTGKKVFKLRCTVGERVKISTKAGSFDAIAVRIQLGFDGHFAAKRDVLAWFSADDRRVPIRFEAEFALGSIVAELLESKRGIRL